MLHFQIFNPYFIKKYAETGIVIPKDLRYLKGQFINNKDKIENYYLTKNFSVKNEHLLVRVLNQFPLMLNSDYYDYLNVLDAAIPYISKALKITSGIEAGKVFPSMFYGNNGESLILSAYPKLIPENIIREQWRTLSCIKSVTHPRNDRKLLLPLGGKDGSKGGLSVISLDLHLLAIKYREFCREQNFKLENGLPLTTNKQNFVSKYVIPGVLESDIDHRFLNAIIDTYYGNPIINPLTAKHQFPIIEADAQFNRYVEQTLDAITTKDLDFINILNNISLIFKTSAAELLSFDSIDHTRQTNWVVITSRLRYMCFLYDVAKNKGKSTEFINDWKILIKRFEMDSGMLGKFNPEIKNEITTYIEKIKDM